MSKILGFIGTGNMGAALIKAACNGKSERKVLIADRLKDKAEDVAKATGSIASNNEDIAKTADYIFLGVKPQMMGDMLKEIAPVLKERKSSFVLVSMAAGIPIEKIKELIGADYPVIRIMPNTPASVGKGMILYCTNENDSNINTDEFADLMASAGCFDKIDEKLIDAASAVSGCGPAFVYMFIEALADGAVMCGLPRDKALLYAAKTVEGSATMALNSEKHPEHLKDDVCSPAGSTIEGVAQLENGAFRANCINAVTAAYKRTKQLGK